MFDRFVRLTQARRALAAGRPEEALRLVSDPLVAANRRGEDVRKRALDDLVERARDRANAGDLRGAVRDVESVLAWQRDHALAASLLVELTQKAVLADKDRVAADEASQHVRRLVDAGDLRAAEAHLAAVVQTGAKPELMVVQKAINARRAAALGLLGQVRAAIRSGEVRVALDHVRQAGALDRQAEGLFGARREIAVAMAASLVDTTRAHLERGELALAGGGLARERALLPELVEQEGVRAVQDDVAVALRSAVEANLRAGGLAQALAVVASLDARVLAEPWLSDVAPAMVDLREGFAAAEAGDTAEAAARLSRAAESFDAKVVCAARDAALADVAAISQAVDSARGHVGTGDLGVARKAVENALRRWPLACALHEEMKILDQSALERQRRLAAVREAASVGRLREACGQALALICPGAQGDEARRLQCELQAKLDVVAAGVDQVKRAAHGRGSGSSEGLAHCIARLDEMAAVQSDHEELPRLREALVVERRCLALIGDVTEACAAGAVPPHLVDSVRELVALRTNLLAVERLDARLLETLDAVSRRADVEVMSGRLRGAERCGEALGSLAAVLTTECGRVDSLRARIDAAQRVALDAVQRGRTALSARELDAAESALDLARRAASDDDDVCALERELQALRLRLREVAEVQAMAAKQDFAAAHDRLASLPPTSAAMRTKIFDLKRSLARAQGLDGGFVLRVDEGGEFLVLRRDSLSIGNLRDGRADLVVLANIAGQHARVQRRMSFHGGMEDRIVADRGEVAVNGQAVREHRLRDGDEISLAGQLRFGYRVPSSRSLTTLLRVLGGFQVRGTDKVLLMKDRGRDGRILIGNSKDAHVPVPSDGPEVELFAGLDGQVRIRFEGNGTMDGRPFTGEHPVTAGVVVACGGVAFVLLPMPPG